MPTLQAAAKPLLQGEEVRPATAEGLICWVTSAAAAAALGVAAVAQHTGRFWVGGHTDGTLYGQDVVDVRYADSDGSTVDGLSNRTNAVTAAALAGAGRT